MSYVLRGSGFCFIHTLLYQTDTQYLRLLRVQIMKKLPFWGLHLVFRVEQLWDNWTKRHNASHAQGLSFLFHLISNSYSVSISEQHKLQMCYMFEVLIYSLEWEQNLGKIKQSSFFLCTMSQVLRGFIPTVLHQSTIQYLRLLWVQITNRLPFWGLH